MSAAPQQFGLMDNLRGVLDVMLGRASGLKRVDQSNDGLMWSFMGLLMAGLIDISALSMLYNTLTANNAVDVGKFFYITVRMMGTLLGYCASLLALYLLCREPDEQERFSVAVIVHNWASPIVSLTFLPLLIIANLFGGVSDGEGSSQIANLISIFWIGVLIFIGLRIMRISLEISVGKAALYFALTSIVSIVVSIGVEKLAGISTLS